MIDSGNIMVQILPSKRSTETGMAPKEILIGYVRPFAIWQTMGMNFNETLTDYLITSKSDA
jgi:hypothetical protein